MLSYEEMWERFMACDRSCDGSFYALVKTTGIYCRPSCRSRKPKRENVKFAATREQALLEGYRACKRCQPDASCPPELELVNKARSFLMTHYKRKLTLNEVAEAAGVSPFYLERLFKKETSETPRAFLDRIRIDKASRLLLTTGDSNLQIGYETGFPSPSHFYKVFRRIMGCSPSEFRNGCGLPLKDNTGGGERDE